MEPINIYGEVRKLITDCVARGEARSKASYVNTIMSEHDAISGDDADFYLICTRHRINDIVSATIGKFTPKTQTADTQLVLDGFEHLQVAYTFERNGEVYLVPIDQCSELELATRAREYEEMAEGCRAHAREIREYNATRKPQAA